MFAFIPIFVAIISRVFIYLKQFLLRNVMCTLVIDKLHVCGMSGIHDVDNSIMLQIWTLSGGIQIS